MAGKQKYRVAKDDVPVRVTRPKAAAGDGDMKLVSQKIYGADTSLMFARRDPGYHTVPHQHDAEQINYIVSGEMWFFVEDRGYRCRKGDIMRIPRNKVHWAWNRGEEVAEIIESHAPALVGDGHTKNLAVSLLGDDEAEEAIYFARNTVVEYDPQEIKAIEERAIRDEAETVER